MNMALPAAPALRQPPTASVDKLDEEDEDDLPEGRETKKSSFQKERRNKTFFGVELVHQALERLQSGVAQFVSAATVHGANGTAVMNYLEDAQMWLELSQIFEVAAVVTLQQVAVAGHMSDVILEVMDWLPKDGADAEYVARSFGHFLKQIEHFDNSQQALSELLEISVECLVAELLVVTTQYFTSDLALSAGAVYRIVKTAMQGLLSLNPKHPALPIPVYQELRTHANKQWSLVLARLCSAHADVILAAFTCLMKGRGVDGDAAVETPLDDAQALAVMQSMQLMNADLHQKLHVSALSNLIEEHLHWLELKDKRPFAVASAQLRAIEALVCNTNFGREAKAEQLTATNAVTTTMMHFMELIFQNLNNWSPRRSQDKPLVPIVNFAMTAILVRSSKEFYGSQIQLFLHKKLLKSSITTSSLRENALQCVLFILRGPEFTPRQLWRGQIQGFIPPLPRNPVIENQTPADPARSDPYVCTIANFEGKGTLFRHDQLSWIQEALFPIKAGAQMKDMVKAIPLCTHVLVQVAANWLGAPDYTANKGRARSVSKAKTEMAAKDMHAIDVVQLLLDFKLHKQMTYLLVALRAMQLMLNTETGFLKGARTSHVNSFAGNDNSFDDAIEQLKIIVAISIQEQLPKILELAGTGAMGICEEKRTMPNILQSTKPDGADIINSMPTNHKARLHIQVLQEMLRTLPYLNWRSGLRSFGQATLLLHRHEPIAVSASVAFQKCSLNTPQYRPACVEILVEMIDSPSPRALEPHSVLTVLEQQAMLLKTWRRVLADGIDGRARRQAAEDELNIVVEDGDAAPTEGEIEDYTQYLPWMRKLESQAVCFLAHGEVKVRARAFELLELVFQIRRAREALAAEMVALKGDTPPADTYRWPCVWEILHEPAKRGMLVQQALYRRRLVGSCGVVLTAGTDLGSLNSALNVAATSATATADASPVGSLLRSSALWTHTIPGVCSALVQHANPELVLSIRTRLYSQIQQQLAHARSTSVSKTSSSQPSVVVAGGTPTDQKEKEMFQHRHSMLFGISGVAVTRQQYKAGWRLPVSAVWEDTLKNQRGSVEEVGAGEANFEVTVMNQMLQAREHIIGYAATARQPPPKNGTQQLFGVDSEASLQAYTTSVSTPLKKNETKVGATGSWLWDGLLVTDDVGSDWIFPALQMACVSAHPYVVGVLAASLQQWYAAVQKQLMNGKGSSKTQQEKHFLLSRAAHSTARLLRFLTLAPGQALWQIIEPRPDLDDRLQPSPLQPAATALLAALGSSVNATGSMVKMATTFASKLDVLILITAIGTAFYQFRLQVSLVDHNRAREIAHPPDWDFDDRYRLYTWLRRTHPWPLGDSDWEGDRANGNYREGSQNVLTMKHAMRAMAALLLQGSVLKDEDVVVLLQEAAGRKASLMNLQWFIDADKVVSESYNSMHSTGPDMSTGIDSTCMKSATGTLTLTSAPQIPSNAPCCLLRHLLSYHPKELGYMSTTCVQSMQRPSALRFFHALCDQVLPDRTMPQPSNSGVVADTQLHLKALANWGRRLDHAHLTHHGMLTLLRKSADDRAIYSSVQQNSKRASMIVTGDLPLQLQVEAEAEATGEGELSFHEMEQVSFTRPAAADPAVNNGLSTSWGKRGETALLLLGLRALLDPDRHTRTRAFMLVQRSILGVVLMAEMYLQKEPESEERAAKLASLEQHATTIDRAMTDKRRRFDGESYEDVKKDAAAIATDVAHCLGACALVSEAVVGWPLETFTRAKDVTSVLVAFFEEVFERPIQRMEWGGPEWNTQLISDFCAQVDVTSKGFGKKFLERLFTFSILNQTPSNMLPWKKLFRSTPSMESPHPNVLAVMSFLIERYCSMLQTKHAISRASTPEEQLMQDIVGSAFKAHPATTVAILVKNLSIQAPEYASSVNVSHGKRTMLQLTASVFLYELALTDMEPIISHMPVLLTTILLLFPSASVQRKFQRINTPSKGADLDNMLGESLPGLLHNLIVGMAPHLHGLKEGKSIMAGASFDFASSKAQSLAASTNELAALLLCSTVEMDWEMQVDDWQHLPGVDTDATTNNLQFRPLKKVAGDGAILSEHGSTRSLMESHAVEPTAHRMILTPHPVSGGVPIRAFITQLLRCLGDEEAGSLEVAGQGRYSGKNLRAAMAQQALGWALHSAGAAIGDSKRGDSEATSFNTAQVSEASRVCQRAHRLLQLLVRGSDADKMVSPLLLRLGTLIKELEVLYERFTNQGFAIHHTVPAQLERIRALSQREMAEPEQLDSAMVHEEIQMQEELEASQAHLYISIAAKEVFYSLQAALVTMLRSGGAGAALGAHEMKSKKVLAQASTYAVALLRAPLSAASSKLGVFQDLGGVSQVEIIFDLGLQLLVSLFDMVKTPDEVLSAMNSVPAELTAAIPKGIGPLQLAPLLQHGFAVTRCVTPSCTHLTMRAFLHLVPTYMRPSSTNLQVCDSSPLPLFRLLLLPLPWLVMKHGGQQNYDTSQMRAIVVRHLPAGNKLEDGTSIPRPADAKKFAVDLAKKLRPGSEGGSSMSKNQQDAIKTFTEQLDLYAGEGVAFEGFVGEACKAVWQVLGEEGDDAKEKEAATLLSSTLQHAVQHGTPEYQTAALHVIRHFAILIEKEGNTNVDSDSTSRAHVFGKELAALVPWASFIAISGKALQSAVNANQQMDRDIEASALVAGVRMRKQSVTGIGVFKPSGTSIQQAALAAIEALVALSLNLGVGDLTPMLDPDNDPGAVKEKKKLKPLVAPWMESGNVDMVESDEESDEEEEPSLLIRDQILRINLAMADEAGIEMKSDVHAVREAIRAAKTMNYDAMHGGVSNRVSSPRPPPVQDPATIPSPRPPPIDETTPSSDASIGAAVGAAVESGLGTAGNRLKKQQTGDEFHEESSTAKAIAAQKARMGGIDMSALRGHVKSRAPTAGSGGRGSVPEGAMAESVGGEETEFV
jgi:hypothetical protein